jgi:hypothetical protein
MDCDWADQVLQLVNGLTQAWGTRVAVIILASYFIVPRWMEGVGKMRRGGG